MTDTSINRSSSPEDWNRLKPLAQEMRKTPTAGERALWQRLRNRGIEGAKFRRQCAIGPFIVDFLCFEARLVIEVDGNSHATKVEYDAWRQAYLEDHGYRVVRFQDGEVLKDLRGALEEIARLLRSGPLDDHNLTPTLS